MFIESLLIYQNLRKDLEAIGLRVKHYDPFVANKMIHYKQMTITWHVYGLKVSRADKDIFDAFIQWSKDIYKYETKLNP